MNKKRGGSTKKTESEFTIVLQFDKDQRQYKWPVAQVAETGINKRVQRAKKKESMVARGASYSVSMAPSEGEASVMRAPSVVI